MKNKVLITEHFLEPNEKGLCRLEVKFKNPFEGEFPVVVQVVVKRLNKKNHE